MNQQLFDDLLKYKLNETQVYEQTQMYSFRTIENMSNEIKRLKSLKAQLVMGKYVIKDKIVEVTEEGEIKTVSEEEYFNPETGNIFDYLTSEIIDVKENYESL